MVGLSQEALSHDSSRDGNVGLDAHGPAPSARDTHQKAGNAAVARIANKRDANYGGPGDGDTTQQTRSLPSTGESGILTQDLTVKLGTDDTQLRKGTLVVVKSAKD